jgi:hypothetical protein
MSAAVRKYIVVENSGMVGERDMVVTNDYRSAVNWLERAYSEDERDYTSPNCLFPDICVEIDGERSYEL